MHQAMLQRILCRSGRTSALSCGSVSLIGSLMASPVREGTFAIEAALATIGRHAASKEGGRQCMPLCKVEGQREHRPAWCLKPTA